MIGYGMFCRACGGFYMFFRRLQCLFAVKMWCENGKALCENGEMVMRCSVLMLGLLHFGFKKWRKRMRLRRLRDAMLRLPR